MQISTFDIGTPAKLSRLTLFDWGYDNAAGAGAGDRRFYTGEHMRRFEIWGTMTPSPDGSLDGWTLLATFENEKPSQLPYGHQSQEDFDTAVKGFDFVFPVSAEIPKVRYVRIRNLESWTVPRNSVLRRSTFTATRADRRRENRFCNQMQRLR